MKKTFAILAIIASISLIWVGPVSAGVNEVKTCEGKPYNLRLFHILIGREPTESDATIWLYKKGSLYDVAEELAKTEIYKKRQRKVDDRTFVTEVYKNFLGRDIATSRAAIDYWTALLPQIGRDGFAVRVAKRPQAAQESYIAADFCVWAGRHAMTQVRPGIMAKKEGRTSTVLLDNTNVAINALTSDGRQSATSVRSSGGYDVVFNANWFARNGSTVAPLVSNGIRIGSADDKTKGFLGHRNSGDKISIWHGEVKEPPSDVVFGVSGIHLVHKGKRADEYFKGMFQGYTFDIDEHSALGYTKRGRWIIMSSYDLNASQLADKMIAFGAVEAVMLDGSDSTQLDTHGAAFDVVSESRRPVASHVIVKSEGKILS